VTTKTDIDKAVQKNDSGIEFQLIDGLVIWVIEACVGVKWGNTYLILIAKDLISRHQYQYITVCKRHDLSASMSICYFLQKKRHDLPVSMSIFYCLQTTWSTPVSISIYYCLQAIWSACININILLFANDMICLHQYQYLTVCKRHDLPGCDVMISRFKNNQSFWNFTIDQTRYGRH